jgi:putative transposase
MISFNGARFPGEVIRFAVFFSVRHTVSYRDLEEILAERGVQVDHATLDRRVTKHSPLIAEKARRRKARTDRSWPMDETYIRVKGEWVYLCRAVDKHGKTLDFMLSKQRNKTAATRFLARALEVNGPPRKIVIDRSGANTAGTNAMDRMLRSFGCPIPVEMVRIKYLNNMVEQDHRTIKKRVRPMPGFKSFAAASSTLEGIEVANMIRKGQFTPGPCPFAQVAALAAQTKPRRAVWLTEVQVRGRTRRRSGTRQDSGSSAASLSSRASTRARPRWLAWCIGPPRQRGKA